jgi:streptogramin lyase
MTRYRIERVRTPALICALLSAACDATEAGTHATRETLPDGRVRVTYPAASVAPSATLEPDLRIGSVAGSDAETFGQIRDFDVAPDGTIYVLDTQAAEVRAFDPSGAFLRTVGSRGEGPGEISARATGLAVGSDGTLWVDDRGANSLLNLRPEGGEIARHPRIVTTLEPVSADPVGILRQAQTHRSYPEGGAQTGPQIASARHYYKSFDPASGASDSVFIGNTTDRSYMVTFEGALGFGFVTPPFEPELLVAHSPDGHLWVAHSAEHRIARLDAAGDTVLEIVVVQEAPPVTAAERAEWLEARAAVLERAPAARAEIEALVPERKPVLQGIAVDEAGSLWVRRASRDGVSTVLDAYLPDGTFRGSVRLPPGVAQAPAPVLRAGRLYAVATDELGVAYVIRAPLPEPSRKTPPPRRASHGAPLLGGPGRPGAPARCRVGRRSPARRRPGALPVALRRGRARGRAPRCGAASAGEPVLLAGRRSQGRALLPQLSPRRVRDARRSHARREH